MNSIVMMVGPGGDHEYSSSLVANQTVIVFDPRLPAKRDQVEMLAQIMTTIVFMSELFCIFASNLVF